MRLLSAVAIFLACCALAGPRISAQSQPAPSQQPPAQPTGSQNQQNTPPSSSNNPFPEDTNSVPVMPNKNTINLPSDNGTANGLLAMPGDDMDPVHSPDEGVATGESGSSSSLAGIDDIDTAPDTEPQQPAGKRGRRGEVVEPEHHETAAEDESVGKYYLDAKNWKAAISRYESALVLDPDNPDVYWGLAECEHHLGRFAEARDNYQKVMEYDPGSRHAKDAGKALKEPEIANAKATPAALPTTSQP